ncbi:hypothetical protein [Spiroplasma helicoides]|nr:hypothetical protein [Spiroplasma helicoides]
MYKILKINCDELFLNYLIRLLELDVNKKIKDLAKGNKQKVAINCDV